MLDLLFFPSKQTHSLLLQKQDCLMANVNIFFLMIELVIRIFVQNCNNIYPQGPCRLLHIAFLTWNYKFDTYYRNVNFNENESRKYNKYCIQFTELPIQYIVSCLKWNAGFALTDRWHSKDWRLYIYSNCYSWSPGLFGPPLRSLNVSSRALASSMPICSVQYMHIVYHF